MSECDCKVCTDHRRWMAEVNPQDDTARAALDEILERLAMAETEATYYRLKLQGKWPSDQPGEKHD
jgi:hypothetical protein